MSFLKEKKMSCFQLTGIDNGSRVDGTIVASMVQWLNGEVKTHSEILVFVKSRFRKLNKEFFVGSVLSLVLYFLVFLCYLCFVFSIFVGSFA